MPFSATKIILETKITKPYLRYYDMDISEKPSDYLTGDDDSEIHEDVTYELLDMGELWSQRDNSELFFEFGKFLGNNDNENSADDCGDGGRVL